MNRKCRIIKISGTFCEELLVIGPESNEMSEFAPSERHRLGFGIYKYIGFAKLDSPVYMLAKNTTSRVSLILKNSDGYWVGWVNDFILETTVSCI